MKFSKTTLQEKYDALPDHIREAIDSQETYDKLYQITQKYGLHIDKIDPLIEITGYLMLGLIPTNEFSQTLSRELDIREDEAVAISKDVNSLILKPAHLELKELYNNSEERTQNSNHLPSTKKQTVDPYREPLE